MVWRAIIPVLVCVALGQGAAWAQATTDEDTSQNMPRKIREKLTAEGFKDVKVAPGSFVVSATDKEGHQVVMVIGPRQMMMMQVPDDPSQAQLPGTGKDEIIQQ
jgi:hypothetical protein